jgi:GNAT superfamily N-acetyltransferase
LEFRGARLLFYREARRDPVDVSLKTEIEDANRAVWVGTIDDYIVGYASGRIDDLAEDERLGVIEDLFVEPEARSVSVGEALTNAMVAWFEGRGCTGADAMALPGARATKNFFEESGFTARLLVMHRRLGGDRAGGADGADLADLAGGVDG